MKRTGMGPRAARMRLCGKPYASAAAARRSKAGRRPGAVVEEGCPCGAVHVRPPRAAAPVLPAPRPATGFPARVKLLVRARSGNGDPDHAACEACGRRLGRRRGQVHHIIDRGMGGCKDPVINGPANAALLCGTPQDTRTCHGLATAFDAAIGKRGFWLRHDADPLAEPMTLQTGRRVLRTLDGRYLDAPGVSG